MFNPGWHLAYDLMSMLTVSEAVTLSALARQESRGAPQPDRLSQPRSRLGQESQHHRSRAITAR